MTWSNLMDVISEKTDVLKILPEAAAELCTALFRNSPAGIYITRNGKFIYTNIEFRRITGYSHDELFGKDYQRLINPRYRQKPKQNSALLFSDEDESSSHEFKITTREGKKKWISEKITYFKYGGNWLTLGHWLDISEHHGVEKAWREAERRFQLAFEDLSTGMAIVSTDNIFLKCNRAFYQMVGYTEQEVLESRFDEFIMPDERGESGDLMQLFLSLGRPEDTIQKRLVARDGRTIWTAMTISLIGEPDDSPSYFIVHFQDITEKKRVEEGLREQEQLYRSLVDRALQPVAVLDLDCHLTHMSQSFLNLLGYAGVENLLGKRIGSLIARQDDVDFEQVIMQILKEGAPQELQQCLIKQDGSTIPVQLHISWIEDDRGIPACIVIGCFEKREEQLSVPELAGNYVRQLHAFENMTSAIAVINKETIIITVNNAFEKLSGYSREEIEGKKSWIEFVAGEDQSRLKRYHLWRRLDQETAPDTYEFKFCDREGKHKEVLINISSVPGSTNTVAALLDLSSLKRAEKGFAQQWDSLAAFMDSLPAMLCFKDTEGKIIRVNQRFADFIGLARSEIEGFRMSDLMPDGEGQFDQQDKELVRAAEPWIRVPWRFPARGEIRSAWLHKTPVLNDDGDVKGIMVECVDVTEHEDDKLRLLQDIEQLEKTVSGSIEAIARIVEMRDPYISGHQRRVALLASAIAEEMGLSADQVNCIAMASKIHDIGKVYVPIEILSKPGNLNDTERQIVNTHAAGGYDILKHIEFPWPVAEAVYQHHERLDGSGYPRGLCGDEIILPARIIMVADVVEAMSVYRPHRPAFTVEAALIEISGKSGTAYDEQVVNACLRLFRDKDFSL